MKNNYYNYIIIGLVILIIVVAGILLFTGNSSNKTSEKNIIFKLNGEERIYHTIGEPYNDLGIELKENNIDISSKVIVENNVDINKEGTYTVIYKYNNQILTRYVVVKQRDTFVLLGDEEVYLLINGNYDDPKTSVIYNGVDSSNEVKIENNIDTTNPGDYEITYTFDKINKTLTRKVHVSDFSDYFKINYDNKESPSVTLQIEIDKDKVLKYQLPNNEQTAENSTYVVNDNGTYKFIVYDKYGNNIEKTVNITNIFKGTPTPTPQALTASCKAAIKDNKTTITVTANKSITKYIYNNVESKDKTYTFERIVKDNKVTLTDSDNQTKEITCTTIEENKKLEIHFIKAAGFYDDAIFIRSEKASIFLDGGRGKEAIMKYLSDLKIKSIDYIIGSHTEYDHIDAEGSIISTYPVKRVIYANDIYKCGCRCENKDVSSVKSALNKKGLKAEVQSVPSKLVIEDMTLYFIAPWKLGCNKNNNSFVFILQFGDNKFMFTGDSDSPLQDVSTLTKNAQSLGLANINVDMVKYPHHGNEWISDKFIDAVNAKAYVVPNINTADKPNSNFMNKMKSKGVPVYRQSDSKTGNILITSDGTNIKYTMNIEAKDYAR